MNRRHKPAKEYVKKFYSKKIWNCKHFHCVQNQIEIFWKYKLFVHENVCVRFFLLFDPWNLINYVHSCHIVFRMLSGSRCFAHCTCIWKNSISWDSFTFRSIDDGTSRIDNKFNSFLKCTYFARKKKDRNENNHIDKWILLFFSFWFLFHVIICWEKITFYKRLKANRRGTNKNTHHISEGEQYKT